MDIFNIRVNTYKNQTKFNSGDKVLYKPIDYRNHSLDRDNIYYAKTATVISDETLDRYWIAFDCFPDCNNKERVNRFCANREELILIRSL